ncbi:MAG: site-2 protease family protein [Clostridiales bacterium]|nr:site-2 protease family protein [Clostridiales bacterium]
MLFEIIRSGASIPEIIIEVTMLVMVLSFTFSIHEFSHAWVAEKMGDDTPRRQGRITLNPLAHIDPLGTVMLFLAGFGWAKPVQYNPNNLKRFKRWNCERLIALAGVTANYITAIVGSILIVLISYAFYKNPPTSARAALVQTLVLTFFYYLTEYGFLFMAFNLIPIPPLDGYRFLSTFIPYKWRNKFEEFSQYSYYIFFALLLMGRFGNINILSKLVYLIETPFRWPVDKLVDYLYSVL